MKIRVAFSFCISKSNMVSKATFVKLRSVFYYSFFCIRLKLFIIYTSQFKIKFLIKIPKGFFLSVFNNLFFIFVERSVPRMLINKGVRTTCQIGVSPRTLFSTKILVEGLGFKFVRQGSSFLTLHVNRSYTIGVYLPAKVFLSACSNHAVTISCFNKVLLESITQVFIHLNNSSLYKTRGFFFFGQVIFKE